MFKKGRWFLFFVFIFVLVGYRTYTEKYFEIVKNLDIFTTLFKEINTHYVDSIDPQKLIRTGIDGMLESLDPYTDYIPESEAEDFRISTTGQYGGIGALIGQVNNTIVVTHPYRNFPAWSVGVKVGDAILAIDGQSVQGKTSSQVSGLLKGQPKTEVEVRLKRYGEKENIVLKINREKINIKNISFSGMLGKTTGYICLDDFTPGASKEVKEAILELKEKGATGLILDLRDNPGGLLHEAVNIVNLFLPKDKEVVSTKGKINDWNKTYSTLNTPTDVTIPLTVLVNEGSASASEIVAGALQDYDRAILIGEKTFGKGLVQTTRSLVYNSQLKVTTARYYIPSGRCVQALDYAHRNKNGTVDKIADSLKKEFKTKAGRNVYDGGGLDPDIVVEEGYYNGISTILLDSGYFFEYACRFIYKHPQPPVNFNSFNLSDEQYNEFVVWLKEEKFNYTSPIEGAVKELSVAAKEESYSEQLQEHIESIYKQIHINKTTDLFHFKSEIKNLLEQQIAFHYNLTEGQSAVALPRDKAVMEALFILSHDEIYKKTLAPR